MDTNRPEDLTGLANFRVRGKMQKCKVVRADWFGPHGRAVTLGETFEALAHDARDWRARGLVEFV